MHNVQQITDLDDLMKVWRRLFKLVAAEDGRATPEDTLERFLYCLKNGAVFIVRGDFGISGSACVETIGHKAVLHSLPKDNNCGDGKKTLAVIREWAKRQGLVSVQVSTTKLSGSSYRYFEKSLGFRRKSVTFSMDV